MASEMAPRIPPQPMTSRCRHGLRMNAGCDPGRNRASGDTSSDQASRTTTTVATTAADAPASMGTGCAPGRWSTIDRSSSPSSTNSADSSRKISVRQNIVPVTREAGWIRPSVRVPRYAPATTVARTPDRCSSSAGI
jgi:hypothetical protein